MALVPKAPPNTCPKCKRTMRPHCPKVVCGWVYCPLCVLTVCLRDRRSFGKSSGISA